MESSEKTDLIFRIQDPYMSQIAGGTKDHEFRKYRLSPSVKRIWFYRTEPHSAITHVCEISPAKTRDPGDTLLPGDGLGNAEFNDRHAEWEGYDFAYEILSVYELAVPISLQDLTAKYEMKSAPRSRDAVPPALREQVELGRQTKLR